MIEEMIKADLVALFQKFERLQESLAKQQIYIKLQEMSYWLEVSKASQPAPKESQIITSI